MFSSNALVAYWAATETFAREKKAKPTNDQSKLENLTKQ